MTSALEKARLNSMQINVSEQAKAVLRSGSDRIGAMREHVAPAVVRELRDAGLLGANNGLTIRGSGAATTLAAAHLDELFG